MIEDLTKNENEGSKDNLLSRNEIDQLLEENNFELGDLITGQVVSQSEIDELLKQ